MVGPKLVIMSGLAALFSHHFVLAFSDTDLQNPLLPLSADAYTAHGKLNFELKHIYSHGTYRYANVHRRLDLSRDDLLFVQQEGNGKLSPAPTIPPIETQPIRMQRLRQRSFASRSGVSAGLGEARVDASAWRVDEVPSPNITDKTTVMSLGIMAENTYFADDHDQRWEDIGSKFNDTANFGWDDDGLRGHVFADDTNQTIIIGIKGTSLGYWWSGSSDTDAKDKANDNVLFGCCCGSSAYCDCESSSMTCNNTCVAQTIKKKSYYYTAAEEIYTNVSKTYPDANVWMVGHSLGGSVASLVGLAHHLPSVTFEAPGQAMAASRLGLPVPPQYDLGSLENTDLGIWNFGHNADALFLGLNSCLGFDCRFWGYAMQSQCHVGMTCVYNTTGDFGWTPSIQTHGIFRVVHEVIEYYNETARCKPVTQCQDCSDWSFYDDSWGKDLHSS